MINIEATIRFKGYNPNDLSKGSNKKVWANCDNCGKGRWVKYQNHRKGSGLCNPCAKLGNKHTEESKKKISATNKGKKLSKEHREKKSKAGMGRITTEVTKKKISAANKGNKHSAETKKKISDANKGNKPTEEHLRKNRESSTGRKHSKETRRKMSAAQKGRIISKEHRKRMSAGQQHIPYIEWDGFTKNHPYCPAFNETCKESNRKKYDKMCFICGLPANENVTQAGKLWNLSVHHINMDKNQGCDGKRWKLIPVCIHCHGMVHTELWNCRITYLLNDTI